MADSQEKRKIAFTVAGSEFTVLSAEEESYTAAIAERIDRSIREMCRSGRVSITAAAILTAVNYCDDLQKTQNDMEVLKEKLKFYLDQIAAQQERYNELQKECDRLREEIQVCRRRLSQESPGINEDEPISPAIKPVRRSIAVSESEEAADEG